MTAQMYGMAGKTAIVTGGASGIGRAIALRLAREGVDVGIIDFDADGSEETAAAARALGRTAVVARADVGSASDVKAAVDHVLATLGHCDILMNNAGILRVGKILECSEKDWSDLFHVNVDGVFHVARAVVPGMVARRSGAVVNMASWLGKSGVPNYGGYCATKFAVVAITQSLAKEVAEFGVRVNAVAPGLIVQTRMRTEADEIHRQKGLPLADDRVKTIPLRRAGLPDDVAQVAVFLASDQAGYLTGETVNVTGGLWNS
jgi:NAD(P)-dependent dehydrogenase (short-subunit alcohol dehydrogenase family)